MNFLERSVYNLVKSNPWLKRKVRNIYQSAFDLFVSGDGVISDYKVVVRSGYFFGFHDVTPFSIDGLSLLGCCAGSEFFMPNGVQPLELVCFKGKDLDQPKKIAVTHAWNWHLGCRLQWLGSSNDTIIFNDLDSGRVITRILDISTNEELKLSGSISTCSRDGTYAVSVAQDRLQYCMPGYGYINCQDDGDLSNPISSSTGLFKTDIENATRELIIDLDTIVNAEKILDASNFYHFVSHPLISPCSKYIVFMHRWMQPWRQKDQRKSRLVLADRNGNLIRVFNTDGMVSHISWRSSREIVAYCSLPIVGSCYAVFDIGSSDHVDVLLPKQLTSDGHPNFNFDSRWMITDTYPDRTRRQKLLLADMHSRTLNQVASFKMPKSMQSPDLYHHWSCDLHPRWDYKTGLVAVDTAFEGRRSLCTINLDSLVSVGKNQ